jgi:hypothetical protein
MTTPATPTEKAGFGSLPWPPLAALRSQSDGSINYTPDWNKIDKYGGSNGSGRRLRRLTTQGSVLSGSETLVEEDIGSGMTVSYHSAVICCDNSIIVWL